MSSAENQPNRNEISAAELQILQLKATLWDLSKVVAQKEQMLSAANSKIIELQRKVDELEMEFKNVSEINTND